MRLNYVRYFGQKCGKSHELPELRSYLMKKSRLAVLQVFLLTFSFSVFAQQTPGTTFGNYAGVASLQLNPSALLNSKSYLDIQLFGIDGFIQNNYLYLSQSDYRFSNFFKAGYQWPTHDENDGDATEQRIFYQYTNHKNKDAFVQTRIDGPAAMLIRGHHAFALSTALRSVISLVDVPYELANFLYLGLDYETQHEINYTDNIPIRASGMAWGEIGISYSNTFYSKGFNVLSAGITIKRLMGLDGMYLDARKLDYAVLNDTTLAVRNLDAEMGFSLPIDYHTSEVMSTPLFKGGGFGIDLGVTYTRLVKWHQNPCYTALCAQPYEDYIYRVGVALIDFGAVRFSKNAGKIVIDNRSSYWNNLTNMSFASIDQFIDTVSYKFYGDTTSAWAGDRFTMWLPAALSAQFDYHLRDNWYINTSLIYGFPVSRNSIVRPAELSVTPRYETRWFEASMPVSLYNWQLARIGLALRVYGLTIGTDKIGGFFHFSDFTGLDFYMSLKFFLDKGNCRDSGPLHCGCNAPKKVRD